MRKQEQKLGLEMRDFILKESALAFIEFEDPEEIMDRLAVQGSVLSEMELYTLLLYLRESRRLKERFAKQKENYTLIYEILDRGVVDLKDLNIKFLSLFGDEGKLKDNASRLLSELRRKIHTFQRKVQEKAAKIAHEAAGEQIADNPQVAFRNGRLVIPVRASRKNQIPGIIHDQSQSGQTIYIEPMIIVELNNELRQAELAERDEVYRILREKTEELRPRKYDIQMAIDSYHHLDILHAKAIFSAEFRCELSHRDSDGFLLKEARNLELQLKREVVPLNLNLSAQIRGVVITGPNAGGKTVTLKTIGLTALMNQAGLLIPVEMADIPDFDAIFIDIGDGQSIDGDLSTYSSHINRLKNIMDNAGKDSLVLLDELGTGTDPDEGEALAEAILTHLTDIGAMVIATTHHSALKSFAYNNDKMMNASMSFNDKDLAPTYEFKAGIPGSSYAIEIARRYHMPENILEFARKRIGKGREKLEKLITDLQRKIHRYDSNLKGLKNREADLKEKSQSIDKMKKEISVKYKKADKEALKKSQVFVQNMYSEFERTIQELKESQASPAAIKKARTELAGLQSEVSEKLDKVEESKEQQLSIQKLKAGDKVWVKSMEQNGIIREINQKNNKIWVDISGTRMRLDIGWLAPHRKRKQKIQTTVTSDNSFVKYRLDLRGKRMDTAISELEKFLDSAILSGLNSVEILHGKGDGILKKAVEDILPSDPRVKKFQMAPVEQGGAGITLVDLNK